VTLNGDTITTRIPNVNNGDVTAQPIFITYRKKKCEICSCVRCAVGDHDDEKQRTRQRAGEKNVQTTTVTEEETWRRTEQ